MQLVDLVDDILNEPRSKENGFVFKHLEQGRLILKSSTKCRDPMRELHDIEDHQFGPLCEEVLRQLSIMIDKS